MRGGRSSEEGRVGPGGELIRRSYGSIENAGDSNVAVKKTHRQPALFLLAGVLLLGLARTQMHSTATEASLLSFNNAPIYNPSPDMPDYVHETASAREAKFLAATLARNLKQYSHKHPAMSRAQREERFFEKTPSNLQNQMASSRIIQSEISSAMRHSMHAGARNSMLVSANATGGNSTENSTATVVAIIRSPWDRMDDASQLKAKAARMEINAEDMRVEAERLQEAEGKLNSTLNEEHDAITLMETAKKQLAIAEADQSESLAEKMKSMATSFAKEATDKASEAAKLKAASESSSGAAAGAGTT